jgi:hypothetical protein
MLKKSSLKFLFVATLALVAQGAFAEGVSYTGDITDSQHAQTTGADAGTTGASAEVTMDYEIPDVVAIGVYTAGDITSTAGAPLLAGRFATGAGNSDLIINNQDDVLNDIVKAGNEVDSSTNTDYFKVNGVVYSSTGAGTLTLEPGTVGGTTDLPANSISVSFTNQSGGAGAIDVAFNGSFIGGATAALEGTSASLTNGTNTAMDTDNRGNFNLLGDVIESSVSNADDVGTYTGSMTITITAL